jgi:N-acyl-D-aspartate/D-glutamate deacylase
MQQFDLLIRNGRIVDGTGAPAYRADLGLRNGRIAAIGQDLGTPRSKSMPTDCW